MQWHAVCQVGPKDTFVPDLPHQTPRLMIAIDNPEKAYTVANHLLDSVYKAGLTPTVPAIDLLNLAMAVYTADLRISRDYSDSGWTREILLHAPVQATARWSAASQIFLELVSFLTGDQWAIDFRQAMPTSSIAPKATDTELATAVCLFSGGLDSFVGAIDLLASGKRLALVGHHGNSRREQSAAYAALLPTYEKQMMPFWFYLLPPKTAADQVPELSMRSRSLLFLALGTAVASALPAPTTTLYVPENGFISLNVPLTFGRTGSHSTRTTHPHTIATFQRLLDALGIPVTLEMPYRYRTKGEMLQQCANPGILKLSASKTMSCSRPQIGRYSGKPVGQHCGYCVPCIIRRAALCTVNLDSEPRHFDVLSNEAKPHEPTGVDKRAFLMAIERLKAMSDLDITSDVLNSGPLPHDRIADFVNVYRRGILEVATFLAKKT